MASADGKTPIGLGDLVEDVVTGFKGVVTVRSEFLNKCVRVSVQPQELREGKTIDSQGFDEEQCRIHGNPKGSLIACIECTIPADICPLCYSFVQNGMLREHGENAHRAIIAPPKTTAPGMAGV